jgi:hypothetical protein
VLPEPPPELPAAPRAFYAALREGGAPDALEVDFGDSGIGVTFAGGVGAQVSRRAAVAFDGNEAAHFDESSPGWEMLAASWVLERLGDGRGAGVDRP